MQPYERLVAWQRCHQLLLAIFSATAKWPSSERFGITAQLRRATLSAATNLVEGSAKHGRAEFRRFLDMSLGSLAEVGYLLRVARDLRILTPEEWSLLESSREDAARMVWLLYRSLGQRPERRSTTSAGARAP